MMGTVRKLLRRFVSVFLAAAITVPMLYGISFPAAKASAAETFTKTASNTQLGANGFAKPVVPTKKDDPWQGSYVYYGTYNGEPVRYRVLDFYTQKYKEYGRTIFLDCDISLFRMKYDPVTFSSVWDTSSIREFLNGDYVIDSFSNAERNAIVESRIEGGRDLTGISMDAMERYKKYVGLNGDKVFLLDIEEVLNTKYGYYNLDAHIECPSDTYLNQAKKSIYGGWSDYWLRSQDFRLDEQYGKDKFFPGEFEALCGYVGWQPDEAYMWVSPAMNINSEDVLFSSAINGEFGKVGTEYKLTLIDENLSITPRDIQKNGNEISFEAIVGGFDVSNPPRISYFITTEGWNYGTYHGKPQNMLAYGEVTKKGNRYSLTVPSNISGTWNEDYCIFVVAEDINGKYETDYASRPVFLNTPVAFSKTTENTMITPWDIQQPYFNYDRQDFDRSLIWYGKYNGQPVAYRMLEKNPADKTFLLDSNEVLFRMSYNPDHEATDAEVWEYSQIRTQLNGAQFLHRPGVFTDAEKYAIASKYSASAPFMDQAVQATETFGGRVGLTGEKIFLLDVQDIYGFSLSYYRYGIFYGAKQAAYDDGTTTWWVRNGAGTRTVDVWGAGEVTGHTAGIMETDGRRLSYDIVSELNGVSPAMYLNVENILFASAVKGALRDDGTEYKLTVIDPNIKLSVTNATVSGKKVRFDYDLSGENKDNVTKFSYLITRLPYVSEADDNVIIAYGEIPVIGYSRVSRLTFNLPDNLPGQLGSDYYVYILAEDINGMYETDYSSKPARVHPILDYSFEGKNSSNTRLGIRPLAPPAVPESEDSFWTGDYIYFGKYDDFPVCYRVLDKVSSLGVGGTGVLLQTDRALMALPFNDTPTTCDWAESTLKAKLNGEEFLNKNGVFTSVEKDSILETYDRSRAHMSENIDLALGTEGYVGLNGEKIFIPDVEDLMNEEYGYCNAIIDPSKATKVISDFPRIWIQTQQIRGGQIAAPWTRNGAGYTEYPGGDVMYWGRLYSFRSDKGGFLGEQVNLPHFVTPSLVLDPNSVIMMSAAFGKLSDTRGRCFVLTLHDPQIILETGSFTQTGDKVEFEYHLSGANAPEVTQLSYVITEKDKHTFNKVDDLKYYGQVTVSGDILQQTKGSFYLPAEYTDKAWGTDFSVFILAEQITGRYETDYASELIELKQKDMAVLFDLTGGGKKRLNQSHLDAIDCLFKKHLIDVSADGESIQINLDPNEGSSYDVKITQQGKIFYIEKLSGCSTGEKVLFTDRDTGYLFSAVAFIIPRKLPKGTPQFDRHALRLADEIGVRFGITFPDNLILNDCYVNFTSSDGRRIRVSIDDAERDTSDSNVIRYYFSFNINALELQDTIDAALFCNGELTATDTYCALDYIHAIQDNPDLYGEKTVALVNALLDYGYYFQRSGWKDNGEHIAIAEPSKHLDDSYMFDAAELLEDYTTTKELGQSGIEKVQIGITLNSRTELKIYVKLASGVSMASGGYTMAEINGEQYYVFSISNIGPKNLGMSYTKIIETNRGSASVSTSVMSYLNSMMNGYSLNEQQMRALSAYYNYYMAAYNY